MSYIDDFEASKLRLEKRLADIENLKKRMEEETTEQFKEEMNNTIHSNISTAYLAHAERLVQLFPCKSLTREWKIKLQIEIQLAINYACEADFWLTNELTKNIQEKWHLKRIQPYKKEATE